MVRRSVLDFAGLEGSGRRATMQRSERRREEPITVADATQHKNRLAQESSPYLLQHQHNPVDWYPWGPEAFEASRRLNRPIFLSVGYSTCYWCHVMERQSFENAEIAALM